MLHGAGVVGEAADVRLGGAEAVGDGDHRGVEGLGEDGRAARAGDLLDHRLEADPFGEPVALERDNAVAYLRETMGATDSKKAAPGTIRNLFGTDVQYNAIHGSDSAENAAKELAFFFSRTELIASG